MLKIMNTINERVDSIMCDKEAIKNVGHLDEKLRISSIFITLF